MEKSSYQVYPYRWVVLVVYMLVVAVNQLMWITFAPITGAAAKYYGVDDLSIGLLSMIFMVVYIIVSIPASWAIDRFGVRKAVGLGAILTGVFGMMRGLTSNNFTLILIAQIGIAVGQPLVLNAVTTVAARWFAAGERAIASGLGSLAIYLGILAGMAATPAMVLHFDIAGMLIWYGAIGLVAALLFVLFAKDRPPTPAGDDQRSLVFDGLKQMMKQRDFILLLSIFFIGLGVFNAVSTWIEELLRPRGFSITQAGATGGLMILGGIVGAVIVPTLSDSLRKRKPFILLSLIGAILGLVGVTVASGYGLLRLSAFVMGFFLLSAGPLGFQYGAEITRPAPEGTSNGMLLMMGQISGIAFILGMDMLKSPQSGSMTFPLSIMIGLMVLGFFLGTALKESEIA